MAEQSQFVSQHEKKTHIYPFDKVKLLEKIVAGSHPVLNWLLNIKAIQAVGH